MADETTRMRSPVFEIADIISTPRGIAIVGTNAALDHLSETEIAEMIGSEIEITSTRKVQQVPVLGIEVSTSLANRKNIFVLISERSAGIAIGSSVFGNAQGSAP